jgi:hypothetical protein
MHNYREDKYNITEIIKYMDRKNIYNQERDFHSNYLDKFTQYFLIQQCY